MRVHLVVRGRVQGVGFRWFVREAARRLDLAGWVQNLPNGDVEVAAEGADASIQALRAALARGPSGAVVRAVDELEVGSESLDRPFTIGK